MLPAVSSAVTNRTQRQIYATMLRNPRIKEAIERCLTTATV